MNSHIERTTYLDDPYALAYPETAPFWAAAEQQRLLLKTCNQCKRAHWYPRIVCPLCASDDTDWKPASGQGSLYAFSIIERADPPYALAYIELDEGPILLSNLVDCDLRALRIGQRVSAVFRQTPDGRSAPYFTIAP
ncbi:Zn-ribbon domain-containing OB-fold protein [Achromobacter pestifer]